MSDRLWWALVIIVVILLGFLAGMDAAHAASFIEATGVAAEAGAHLWRLMGVTLLALFAVAGIAAFMRKGAK